jgi:hypothetical protein
MSYVGGLTGSVETGLIFLALGMALGLFYGIFDLIRSVKYHNPEVKGFWDAVGTLAGQFIVMVIYSFIGGMIGFFGYVIVVLIYDGIRASDRFLELF